MHYIYIINFFLLFSLSSSFFFYFILFGISIAALGCTIMQKINQLWDAPHTNNTTHNWKGFITRWFWDEIDSSKKDEKKIVGYWFSGKDAIFLIFALESCLWFFKVKIWKGCFEQYFRKREYPPCPQKWWRSSKLLSILLNIKP